LAADFDKKTWQEDSLAFIGTCQRAGVHVYRRSSPRRSRPQNGLRSPHANDGEAPPSWSRLLRPLLPQPGHSAQSSSCFPSGESAPIKWNGSSTMRHAGGR
jgi:hypothetical protein